MPKTGQILESQVRVCIEAGLVELNKHLREATVRRNVVVQLIRMLKERGHPDYQKQSMPDVEMRAKQLTDSDEPAVPNGLTEVLDEGSDEQEDDGTTDKAATPAERIWSLKELDNHMQRTRPQILVPQRDSDAGKEVEPSRTNAFARFATLSLKTGSALLDQFYGYYIPRVFNVTIPWFVGGPDLYNRQRFRRSSRDAPALSLGSFTRMIPKRVETQTRWDVEIVPAIWSLYFATQVNLGVSLSMRRLIRAGEAEERNEKAIGMDTAKIYDLLWNGEYKRQDGKHYQSRVTFRKSCQRWVSLKGNEHCFSIIISCPLRYQAHVRFVGVLIIYCSAHESTMVCQCS